MNREELISRTHQRMGTILVWAVAGAVLGVIDSLVSAPYDPVLIGQSRTAEPVQTILLAVLFGGAAFVWPLWWGGHGRFFFLLGVVGLGVFIWAGTNVVTSTQVPISSGPGTDNAIGYGTNPAFDCGYVFHDPFGNPTSFLFRELADLGMRTSDIPFAVSDCGATMDNYRDFAVEVLGGSIVAISIAVLMRRRHVRRVASGVAEAPLTE